MHSSWRSALLALALLCATAVVFLDTEHVPVLPPAPPTPPPVTMAPAQSLGPFPVGNNSTTAPHSEALVQLRKDLGTHHPNVELVFLPPVVSAATDWKQYCTRIAEYSAWRASPAGAADIPTERAFTIGITTYKGERTIRNTLQSYTKFGFLTHRAVSSVVFHINACDADDVRLLVNETAAAAAAGVRVRVLCSRANVYHPIALYRIAEHTATPFVMLTENDRPVGVAAGDGLPGRASTALRVRRYLDASLDALTAQVDENGTRPVQVYLERKVSDYDVDMYEALGRRTGRESYWGSNICWKECIELALTPQANLTDEIEAYCRSRLPCQRNICREYQAWHGGKRQLSFNCVRTFDRRGFEEAAPRKLARAQTLFGQGPAEVSCEMSSGWSNGPAVINVDWYRRTILTALCVGTYKQKEAGPLKKRYPKTGLKMNQPNTAYGWYGRQMEHYLAPRSEKYACAGDGFLDHEELESYDTNRDF